MLDLYKNIKKRRLELGITQSELAKELGYADKSMIAKIEKGSVDLPLSKIELFANALNINPGELMGNTWESDVLDNARLDIVGHFDGDAFEVAKFQEAEVQDTIQEMNKYHTLAAHFDGDEYTKDELDEIQKYAEFVRSKRKE